MRTGVSAPSPWATARMAMSRSVTMPTRRSPSLTSKAPLSMRAIRSAASRMLCSGVMVCAWRVMTSRIFMESSTVEMGMPHGAADITSD
ncbi:hypothetical protein D3C77_685190 [compost metagenome]